MTDKASLFGPGFQILENSLDLRQRSHQYLVSNIANAQTPGYAPSHLHFEGQLQEAIAGQAGLRATHQKHFGWRSAQLQEVQGTVVKNEIQNRIGDQNGVQMQQEMALLSENQIKYEAVAKMLRGKFTLMQYVIQQGK